MTISIILADDHTVVLDGLRARLSMEQDLEVVDTCTDGEEAVQAVLALKPDVLVLDYSMPKLSGVEALQRLRAEGYEVPAVLLSASLDDDALRAGLSLGNVGVVLKESPTAELVACIRAVHAGRQSVPAGVLERLLGSDASSERDETTWPELTPREIQIVELVARGESNKRVGRALGIGEGTVKQYMHAIFRKLGVGNRVQLAALALERRAPEG